MFKYKLKNGKVIFIQKIENFIQFDHNNVSSKLYNINHLTKKQLNNYKKKETNKLAQKKTISKLIQTLYKPLFTNTNSKKTNQFSRISGIKPKKLNF